MEEHWFKQAIIYCLDVDTFQDSNGDGIGDLVGLTRRLDYLARLGVTCLWLNPVHPTPNRDDGYDVTDFYGVDPRLGTLGDFVELVHQAANRGQRVIIDLVVNHTSDEHPWFQSARSSPESPHRDWYVWSASEPVGIDDGVVFPGKQKTTWTYDDTAGAWYHHRFYDFQPDLNWSNPDVRAEVGKIVAFWLQLGVAGFRLDAAPFVIEDVHPDQSEFRREYSWLDELSAAASWHKGDAILLAEANVKEKELDEFFGDGRRVSMLFNFLLNQRLFLSLARGSAAPLREALAAMMALPDQCTWATFLRNHDEVDLSGLSESERQECFDAFGPKPEMQLYGRGIRRRLAPMLGDDRRQIELAYALQVSLPGTPVLRYGEEIGMGDDLDQPERYSIRTPMQWSWADNAGFSTCKPKQLVRPIATGDIGGYETTNVDAERADENSLLAWFERMLRTLRECPEFGAASWEVLDGGDPRVLAMLYSQPTGQLLAISNLGPRKCEIDLASELPDDITLVEMFSDRHYDQDTGLDALSLAGHGYRWLRLVEQ
ncbi:MAG TPA: alpha-amylase family protein [Acidimicrobiales bacterium]|nr:alpha-amylase family protein [Acidimicrobiales bacterium]